jgi:UDP:flavonoid glycosyltransferase YjiC (YdhE family)
MERTEPISMPRVLVLSSPIGGHVAPMLSAAAGLVARGHEVVFLTGARFADAVAVTGAEHVALPPEADYDDRDIDAAFPQRRELKGMAQLRSDLINTFIDPLPHQYRAVCELLDSRGIDVIVSEGAAIGAVPLVLGARATRPPIVSCGVVPLTLGSRDTAPYGPGLPPMAGPLGRLRNRALRLGVEKVAFRSVQQHANTLLEQLGARPLPVFCFDAIGVLPDRFLQFSVPGFEYPRSDLPPTVGFAGRLEPHVGEIGLPDWWDELDGDRPVVHVTQGTLDTADLDRVIGPTLRALAGEDVLVVAATGGRLVHEVPGPIPANARVAEFLPYDRLLPKVDVMVTNGGFGGVQQALAAGVPLVVSGDGEDKHEIAARVAWSGAGVNLRTGDPSAEQVGDAVRRVLREPAFRTRARALAAEYAAHDAHERLAETVDELVREPQLQLVK